MKQSVPPQSQLKSIYDSCCNKYSILQTVKHLQSEKLLKTDKNNKFYKSYIDDDENMIPNHSRIGNIDDMNISNLKMSKKINLLENNFLGSTQIKKNNQRTKAFISKLTKKSNQHENVSGKQLQQIRSLDPQFYQTYLEIMRSYKASGQEAKRILVEEQQIHNQLNLLQLKKNHLRQIIKKNQTQIYQIQDSNFQNQSNLINLIKQFIK